MHHVHHWELRSAAAHRLSVAGGCVLRVTAGRVWITLEQGSEDIWLLPGQAWCAPGPVHLWISADPVAGLQMLVPVVATQAAFAVAQAVNSRPGVLRRWFSRAARAVMAPKAAALR